MRVVHPQKEANKQAYDRDFYRGVLKPFEGLVVWYADRRLVGIGENTEEFYDKMMDEYSHKDPFYELVPLDESELEIAILSAVS